MIYIIILLAIVGFAGFGILIMVESYGLFLDCIKSQKGDKDEVYNSIK